MLESVTSREEDVTCNSYVTETIMEVDEVVKLLNKVMDIYCENDFLIKRNRVEILVLQHQHLIITRNIIEEKSKKYITALNFPDNGYKSLVSVTDKLVTVAQARLEMILNKVASVNEVNKFIDFWTRAFRSMSQILGLASGMTSLEPSDNLFPAKPDCTKEQIQALSRQMLSLDVSPFYGEIQAFHLRGDCGYFTRMLHNLMIFYCDNYELKLESVSTLVSNLQCLFDEDRLSRKVVDVSRVMDIKSAKSFYSLGENPILKALNNQALPIKQNIEVKIPIGDLWTDSATVTEGSNNLRVKVPVPEPNSSNKTHVRGTFLHDSVPGPPNDTIIFHVHGGGFIAQSPASHVDYLCQWSKELAAPIFSVDYSLAPEDPYPRAVMEVYYAYCWMLEHPRRLGWSGARVLVSGDSAGGNLVTGLVIQCIKNGIRVPSGLHLSYACLLAQIHPSPSRLLMLMDPLLMVGILGKCINAYKDAGYLSSLPRSLEDELVLGTSEDDVLVSPLLAPRPLLAYFPPTLLLSTDVDACLDENVQFRANLEAAGVRTRMEIVRGLPHGFLAFCKMSESCQEGVKTVTNIMKEFMETI